MTTAADTMIEIELKNVRDFRRLVEGQKTVYFKKTSRGFTYYVVSTLGGVGVLNVFKSEHALTFNEDFNPAEPESITVASLVEVEDISQLKEGFP